tara:strand:+ start:194 stop:1327 length:1134 start_codon:yes stop_codon:yes gene_type:complete
MGRNFRINNEVKMYQFTSESVSQGHPDKVADLISDTVATYLINGNTNHRAAVETIVTTNKVVLAGEYKSDRGANKDRIANLVRDVIEEIGYEQEGFNFKTVEIQNLLHGQSPDIALGTDDFGAGDQGIMFGYACEEAGNKLPYPLYYSHEILKTLQSLRKNDPDYTWLEPDSKAQVTFNYGSDGKPIDIAKIVCSTQHKEEVDIEFVRGQVSDVITDVAGDYITNKTEFLINPTGRFVIGGPDGDTGLTGRKIIVDTYGGASPHGGGAFSGKDCTKVDRSAAYMARAIAKQVLQENDFQEVLVQLSYAIGIKEPTSVTVWTDKKINYVIAEHVKANVDLTPLGIINKFKLFDFDLTRTTNYGHFGREDLPWEKEAWT